MNKLLLPFKALPIEVRSFAIAFSLFIIASLLLVSLIYFGAGKGI